jgi:hypothetical protein
MIAGAAMIGVIGAAFTFFDFQPFAAISREEPPATEWIWATLAFLALVGGVLWQVVGRAGRRE